MLSTNELTKKTELPTETGEESTTLADKSLIERLKLQNLKSDTVGTDINETDIVSWFAKYLGENCSFFSRRMKIVIQAFTPIELTAFLTNNLDELVNKLPKNNAYGMQNNKVELERIFLVAFFAEGSRQDSEYQKIAEYIINKITASADESNTVMTFCEALQAFQNNPSKNQSAMPWLHNAVKDFFTKISPEMVANYVNTSVFNQSKDYRQAVLEGIIGNTRLNNGHGLRAFQNTKDPNAMTWLQQAVKDFILPEASSAEVAEYVTAELFNQSEDCCNRQDLLEKIARNTRLPDQQRTGYTPTPTPSQTSGGGSTNAFFKPSTSSTPTFANPTITHCGFIQFFIDLYNWVKTSCCSFSNPDKEQTRRL